MFVNPVKIIQANKYTAIKPCFDEIQTWLKKGFYTAGFISYEAGAAFESALPKRRIKGFPLLRFGVYKKPVVYNHMKNGDGPLWGQSPFFCEISNLKPTINRIKYLSDIAKIKDYIRKGETYQVNYTFKYKFKFNGSPYSMFLGLNRRQPVPYASFISFGNTKILSLSPELFLKRKGNVLEMKPMKGTIERGKDIYEDAVKEKELRNSSKDRAENIMIVDMLRSDLGRIAKKDTVKALRLFETERYQTLFQMTSTIRSRLKPGLGWYDIFKSVFPSGSVTGAPKIRTMQIINELEKQPRNVYTGAIGYISPENDAVFNVAIRTVVLDEKTKKGELGIGSGITISSSPSKEYEECKLKAQFLTQKTLDFKLIETILWQKGKFFLLNPHLTRLKDSAGYFNFKYKKEAVIEPLIKHANHFKKDKKYRVRLLLNKEGDVKIDSSILKEPPCGITKIAFSKKATDASDVFLYHKTTNRKLYDSEYLRHKRKGFADAIFINQKGEVTEGAISNIIIKKGKYYYTPPVSCGLLNGVYRQYLLKTQPFPLKEKILRKEDIVKTRKLFICNSVRGLAEMKLQIKK